MLIRTDPFRDLDRLAAQLMGTASRPTGMPMDAWREGAHFVVEFDLPGVDPDSVDIDVERNVLTVRAQRRSGFPEGADVIAAERPRGVFSRQVILGDVLDTDRINASYQNGVLRLTIPVAEKAKPRKVVINSSGTSGTSGTSGPNGSVGSVDSVDSVDSIESGDSVGSADAGRERQSISA